MNEDIKKRIKDYGLYQYRVADQCGVHETTFVRWLRYPLTDERRKMILSAIETLLENRITHWMPLPKMPEGD